MDYTPIIRDACFAVGFLAGLIIVPLYVLIARQR